MTAIPRPAHDRGGADAVSGGRDQGRVIRPPSSAILALLGCGRRHDSWLVVSPRVCQPRGVAPGERAEFWHNTLVKRYEPIGPALRCTRLDNYSVAKVPGWAITPNDTARASASENQSLRAASGEPTT